MKPGDGEVDPGEPPDCLGFDPSHLRTHPEDAEDPEEEVRPHPPPPRVSVCIEVQAAVSLIPRPITSWLDEKERSPGEVTFDQRPDQGEGGEEGSRHQLP